MAKTARKKTAAKKKVAKKRVAKKRTTAKKVVRKKAQKPAQANPKVSVRHNRRVEDVEATDVEVKGGRLVIQISRDEHPEIFDLNRLLKQTQKVIEAYQRKKKMRDVVEFLTETEKSLQIVLKNHLEDAMRQYLS